MGLASTVESPPAAPRRRSAPPPVAASPAAERGWRRGVALMRRGEVAAAARCFEHATRLAPAVALYWTNLASAQRRLCREADALASAERAVALDGSCSVSCRLLVDLLRAHNRPADALAALRALDAGVERDAQHFRLEGALLAALRRPQDAAQSFLQVLAIQPADAEAYMQLGFALAALDRPGDAAECFRTVAMIEPKQLGAALFAVHYAAWACDWVQGPLDRQRLADAQARLAGETVALSPFCLLSIDDDVATHRQAARTESARQALELRRRVGWSPPDPGPAGYPEAARALAGGRCRVGFVAGEFRTHATSVLLVQTLERLDRSRFELVLYSHGEDDGGALRQRCIAAADRFVDCREISLPEQAQRIRDDGIALLIDLGGFISQSRLQLFALRPAPVQASWLAYPGTVGADFIDYLIGDPVVTPMAHAADFDEQLVQLPLCYQPTDEQRVHPETPLGRSDVGLPEDGFVYACFNQSYKITEAVFSRWCRILYRVPGSVLWLLAPQPEVRAALRAQAQQRGIAPQRLVFAPFVDTEQHLARLPLADVFLDTFPCGAHTTCCDALWMGLPVLTMTGRSFASRVAASLLNAVGLAGLAVDDGDDYEELAVRLATDRAALTDIRDHLWDNRRDLPLFDNARFSAELGDALARMVQRWQSGLPPAALPAA